MIEDSKYTHLQKYIISLSELPLNTVNTIDIATIKINNNFERKFISKSIKQIFDYTSF
jgi:hypothetical protein